MVISIDCADAGDHRKLRSMLKKLGLYVEAGTLPQLGLTLAARRVDTKRPGYCRVNAAASDAR
jgi:hypothetical protein